MSLSETHDTIHWGETHYVFLEKTGPLERACRRNPNSLRRY